MKRAYVHIVIMAALCALLFLPFNGNVHLFDWDEVNFAENAREMILSGNYLHNQIAFQPFYEKPPLFMWTQVISMKLFGINAFAARFPNAIIGFFSMWMILLLGKRFRNIQFAWLWVMVYLASLLPQFYFRSGIIDPMFNLFIYGGLSLFFIGTGDLANRRNNLIIPIAGVLMGFAMLAKGPVAFLITSVVIAMYYFLIERKSKLILQYIRFCLFALLPFGIWIIVEWMVAGPEFIIQFIQYQIRLLTTEDAGHGGFPGFHFVVILLACFPASVFALPWLSKWKFNKTNRSSILFWNKTLFWVVILLFSLVQSKIIHYSSLCYFPLSFLAAMYLYEPGKRHVKLLFGIIGVFVTAAFWLLPILGMHPEILSGYVVNDAFTSDLLKQKIQWPWYTFLPGIIATLGIISYFQKQKAVFRTLIIFIISTNLAILSFTGRIEKLTQGSVIEFIIEKEKEGVYTDIRKQKSYADLFYGKYKSGDENNPSYIIHRIDRQAPEIPGKKLVKIDQQNGYIFYRTE